MLSVGRWNRLRRFLVVTVSVYLLMMLVLSAYSHISSPLLQVMDQHSQFRRDIKFESAQDYRNIAISGKSEERESVLLNSTFLNSCGIYNKEMYNKLFLLKSNYSSPSYHCTHPTLFRKCYVYEKLSAHNNCCKLQNYDKIHPENFLECVRKSASWFKSKFRGKSPLMHWMFVGDSHIRNIFDVLIRRVSGPMLMYRKSSYRVGHWRPIRSLKVAKYQGIPITVKHLTVPLLLTFTWSPFLRLLPNLTKEWLNDSDKTPTLVLMGTALHWMRETLDIYNENPEKAANVYKEHLVSLSPTLLKLTARMPVIFKLLDHLPESKNNITNIDVYNSIASRAMPDSVAVWDSIIPLSDQYIRECNRNPRDTPETLQWRCKDGKHSGYVIIEKYVDMLLNYGCNRFLNLNESYCL